MGYKYPTKPPKNYGIATHELDYVWPRLLRNHLIFIANRERVLKAQREKANAKKENYIQSREALL